LVHHFEELKRMHADSAIELKETSISSLKSLDDFNQAHQNTRTVWNVAAKTTGVFLIALQLNKNHYNELYAWYAILVYWLLEIGLYLFSQQKNIHSDV
jgi:hypothetical protein